MTAKNTLAKCAMALAVMAACGARAVTAADRPFMLWTRDEAARMRRQIESEPWAREAYDRASKEFTASARLRYPGPITYMMPLFRYGVLGDKAVGEAQRAKLLKDVADGRIATVENAYRFDVLYDLLSDEQRERVAKAFTEAVEERLDWKAPFNRWNWLPNLAYGGYSRLHLLAAATGDKKLIRRIFHSPLGFKWYLDEYLSDLGFYNEELSKQISPEYMLPWCWAMDRLGLGELGFGYRGRQGATVRGHVESLLRIGLPRVDLGTDLRHYPRLTMGDTRGSFGEEYFAYCFQQDNVPGVLASGPTSWWDDDRSHRLRRWLEYLHAKWPDAGYDYFVAAWRGPGEDRYWFSVQYGLSPIDPKTVKPPPAPSGVYPGRGIVMLRAEEGPAYWESAAPAVGMRLANPYAHHVQDSFALMGFYAFNRPIFINPGRTTDRYCGVDPGFSNSIRSHCAVMVDGQEPRHLLAGVTARHDLNPSVKFAAARAKGIYPGVDQTRALMLTREYLLDASRLVSGRTRDYLWQVHTFGHVCPDNPSAWAPSYGLRGRLPDLGQEESCATDGTWTVTAMQQSCGAHPKFSGMGPRWFEKRVGVRVTMLGEGGTRAYTGWTPVLPNAAGFRLARDRFAYGEEEPARIAVVATRRAAATTFLAVHEPFEAAGQRIRDIRRLAEGDDGSFVVRIVGDTFTDYLMLRFGDAVDQSADMKWDQGAVRFSNYGYVRVAGDRVDVHGDVTGLVLPVGARPARWSVKGKEIARSESVNGYAAWGETSGSRSAAPAVRPESPPRVGPLSARWHPPTELCLPTGGARRVMLKLRNNGQTVLKGMVSLSASGGLVVSPRAVELRDVPAGGEREVEVTVSAGTAPVHQLQQVSVGAIEPADLPVQRPVLRVAHGVTSGGREQIGPDFRASVYSPRYIVRYRIMESGGAAQLLDPQGYRRHDASGLPLPCLTQAATRPDGRTEDRRVEPRRQPYFNPLLIAGAGGEPDKLYDGGWHVHGYQADLEHWWTEDWMLVRQRTAKAEETVAFQWPWLTSSRGGTIMGRDPKLAEKLQPGVTFVVDTQGKRVTPAKGLASLQDMEVRAVFDRPAGYDYGYATFYLPGAKLNRGLVFHPGDHVVGFTFCREEEFDGLLKKWQADPPSGEVSDEVRSRYRGGFGAHPVPAEK